MNKNGKKKKQTPLSIFTSTESDIQISHYMTISLWKITISLRFDSRKSYQFWRIILDGLICTILCGQINSTENVRFRLLLHSSISSLYVVRKFKGWIYWYFSAAFHLQFKALWKPDKWDLPPENLKPFILNFSMKELIPQKILLIINCAVLFGQSHGYEKLAKWSWRADRLFEKPIWSS